MDSKPPRFLIMVTIAVFVFAVAAVLLVMQARASRVQTEAHP